MRDTRFDEAQAAFKRAEADLDRLQTQLGKTSQKLLQAGLDVAAIEEKIRTFATSVDGDPSAAAHLVGKQETARNIALLLEQAEAFLESEVAKTKASIVEAEGKCLQTQMQSLSDQIDREVEAFLKNNASTFQRLLQGLNNLNKITSIEQGGSGDAAGTVHVEQLFTRIFVDRVVKLWSDDTPFREGCLPGNQAVANYVRSERITSEERSRCRVGGYKALLPDEAPSVNDDYDHHTANSQLAYARHQATYFRDRVESLKNDPKQRHEYPLEEYEEEASRWEQTVRNWETNIAKHSQAAR